MDYVVSAVMQKNPISVPPSMTVAELETRLLKERVAGFAVVDEERLVGVVSRTDVIKALSPEGQSLRVTSADESDTGAPANVSPSTRVAAEKMQVKDIMTSDVVTVGPNDHLHEVATLMYTNRIHRIFVVQDERLLGIVTPFDFVRLYSDDRIGVEGRPPRTPDF